MRTRFLATLCLSVLASSCSNVTDGNQDGGHSAPATLVRVTLSEFGVATVGQEVSVTCSYELLDSSYHTPPGVPFAVTGYFRLKHYTRTCVTWVNASDSAWADTLMVGDTPTKSIRLRAVATGDGELEAVVVLVDSIPAGGGYDVIPIYVR